jgi:hypothetical protein
MADWRLRGIPPPLWRKVRDKAGDRLQQVLIGLLRAYADGEIDPLAPRQASLDVVGTSGGKATTETTMPTRGRADFVRMDRMTEAEIARTSPPELAHLPDDFWDDATVVRPPRAPAKKAAGG